MNEESNGRITMAMQATDASNAETAQPTVPVNKHALRTALRLAEKGVHEVNDLLRAAEQERDGAARSLGALQSRVDALTSERDYLTRHVRDLRAPTT